MHINQSFSDVCNTDNVQEPQQGAADDQLYYALKTAPHAKPPPVPQQQKRKAALEINDTGVKFQQLKKYLIASLCINVLFALGNLTTSLYSANRNEQCSTGNGFSNKGNQNQQLISASPINLSHQHISDKSGTVSLYSSEPMFPSTTEPMPRYSNIGRVSTAFTPVWKTNCKDEALNNTRIDLLACALLCRRTSVCVVVDHYDAGKHCLMKRTCASSETSTYHDSYSIHAYPDCNWKPSNSSGVWLVKDLGVSRVVEAVYFQDASVKNVHAVPGTMAIFVGNSSDPMTTDIYNVRCAAVCTLTSSNLNAVYLCNNIIGRYVLVYRGYDKSFYRDSGLAMIYGY